MPRVLIYFPLKVLLYNHCKLKWSACRLLADTGICLPVSACDACCTVGSELDLYDLKDIPIYNQDLDSNLPESVQKFKDAVRKADGIS